MHHPGAFRVVAYGFVRVRDEIGASTSWERYLVRHCECCGSVDLVKLIYVDPEYLTCLTCLSQNVEPIKNDDGGIVGLICLDCGLHTNLDRPLPMELDEDDAPGGWLLPPGDSETDDEDEDEDPDTGTGI